MRLIDADEILTGIEELKISPWATEPYMFHHELAVKEALEIVRDLCVNQAPTVDAVPVVRCTDCWFYQSDNRCGWTAAQGGRRMTIAVTGNGWRTRKNDG